jgi:hypothetical protein
MNRLILLCSTLSFLAAQSTWATGWAEARDYVRRYNGVLNAGNVWMFSSGPLGDPVLTPVDDPETTSRTP